MFPRNRGLPSVRSLDSLAGHSHTSSVPNSPGASESRSAAPPRQHEVIEHLRAAEVAAEDLENYSHIFADQLLRTFADVEAFGEERLNEVGIKRGHARRIFSEIERRQREARAVRERAQRQRGLAGSTSTSNLYGALYDIGTPAATPIGPGNNAQFPSIASGADLSAAAAAAAATGPGGGTPHSLRAGASSGGTATGSSSSGGGGGGGGQERVVVNTSASARNDPMRTAAVVVPGDLSCPLCCEVLYSARTFQCGHSACEHCIASWVAAHPEKPTCPLCRANLITTGAKAFEMPQVSQILENLAQRCFPGRYARSKRICDEQRRAEEEIRLAFSLARHPADAALVKILQNQLSAIPRHIELLFLRLPRREFLPPSFLHTANRIECQGSSPTHVEGFGFNCTSPALHATILSQLQLEPGMTFLDAGAGTGAVAAWAAALVGPTGSALAVDSDAGAARLMRRNRDLHDQMLWNPSSPLTGWTLQGELRVVEKHTVVLEKQKEERPQEPEQQEAAASAAAANVAESTLEHILLQPSTTFTPLPAEEHPTLPFAVQIIGVERSSSSLSLFSSSSPSDGGCVVHASVTIGNSGTSGRRYARMIGTVRLVAKSEHILEQQQHGVLLSSETDDAAAQSPAAAAVPSQLPTDKDDRLVVFSLREVAVFGSDDPAAVFNFGAPQNLDNERTLRLSFTLQKTFGELMQELSAVAHHTNSSSNLDTSTASDDASPLSGPSRIAVEGFGVFLAPVGTALFPDLSGAAAAAAAASSSSAPSASSPLLEPGRKRADIVATGNLHLLDAANVLSQLKQWAIDGNWEPAHSIATPSSSSRGGAGQRRHSSHHHSMPNAKYHCLEANMYDLMKIWFCSPTTDTDFAEPRRKLVEMMIPPVHKTSEEATQAALATAMQEVDGNNNNNSEGWFDRVFLACEPQSDADLTRFEKLLRPGGRMVVPFDSNLTLVTRAAAAEPGEAEFRREPLFQVGFGTFLPVEDDAAASAPAEGETEQGNEQQSSSSSNNNTTTTPTSSASSRIAKRVLDALEQEERYCDRLEEQSRNRAAVDLNGPDEGDDTSVGKKSNNDDDDDNNDNEDAPIFLRCCGSKLAGGVTWADTINVVRIWGSAPFSDGPTVCLRRLKNVVSADGTEQQQQQQQQRDADGNQLAFLRPVQGGSAAYNIDLCARMRFVECSRCPGAIVGAQFCDEPLLTQPHGPWAGRLLLCAPLIGKERDVSTIHRALKEGETLGEAPAAIRCNSCDNALALPAWRLRSELELRERGRRSLGLGGGGGVLAGLLFSFVRPRCMTVEPPTLHMVYDGNVDVADCKCAKCEQVVGFRVERVRNPCGFQEFAFALHRYALMPSKTKGLPSLSGAGLFGGAFGRGSSIMDRIYRAIAQSFADAGAGGDAQIVLRDAMGNSSLITWRRQPEDDAGDEADDDDEDLTELARLRRQRQGRQEQEQEEEPQQHSPPRPPNPAPADDDDDEPSGPPSRASQASSGAVGTPSRFFDPNAHVGQNVRAMNQVIAARLAEDMLAEEGTAFEILGDPGSSSSSSDDEEEEEEEQSADQVIHDDDNDGDEGPSSGGGSSMQHAGTQEYRGGGGDDEGATS